MSNNVKRAGVLRSLRSATRKVFEADLRDLLAAERDASHALALASIVGTPEDRKRYAEARNKAEFDIATFLSRWAP